MLGDCEHHYCSTMLHETKTVRYGDNDQLGFLNRLTDDVVKEAAREIQSGTRWLYISICKRGIVFYYQYLTCW